MDDIAITIADIRKAGHCARMRGWFAEHDRKEEFRTLVKGGSVPASAFADIDDPRIAQVIERARERLAHG